MSALSLQGGGEGRDKGSRRSGSTSGSGSSSMHKCRSGSTRSGNTSTKHQQQAAEAVQDRGVRQVPIE